MDNLESLAVRLGAGRVGLKRALEIVDHGQQLLHEIDCRHLRQILALAIDALAIVVELCGLAEQPVVKAVALLAQLDDFVGERRGRRRLPAPLRLRRPSVRRQRLLQTWCVLIDRPWLLPDYMLSRRTRDTANATPSTTAMVLE